MSLKFNSCLIQIYNLEGESKINKITACRMEAYTKYTFPSRGHHHVGLSLIYTLMYTVLNRNSVAQCFMAEMRMVAFLKLIFHRHHILLRFKHVAAPFFPPPHPCQCKLFYFEIYHIFNKTKYNGPLFGG